MTHDPALQIAREKIAESEKNLDLARVYLTRALAAAGRFVTYVGDARDLDRADANGARVIEFAEIASNRAKTAREVVRGTRYTGTNRTVDRLLKTALRLSREARLVREFARRNR
jgi:hypothetical protein